MPDHNGRHRRGLPHAAGPRRSDLKPRLRRHPGDVEHRGVFFCKGLRKKIMRCKLSA
jgi:hypothetical protein